MCIPVVAVIGVVLVFHIFHPTFIFTFNVKHILLLPGIKLLAYEGRISFGVNRYPLSLIALSMANDCR